MAHDERKLVKKKTKYANEDNYLSLAETCQRLGELYKDREEYQRALNEYKLAAKAYEKLNRMMDRGLAYRMIGEMHLMMGQFTEALRNVQAHMRAARKEANQLEIQRASVTLGRVYLHRAESYLLEKKASDAEADLIEADRAFQMGLSLCNELQRTVRKTELIEMQAGTYLNLGVTADRRGKTDTAQEHMERAIRLAREADSFELLHTCYNTMALSCSQWERTDGTEHCGKTLRLLNHGLEVASRLSNRSSKMCQTLLLKAEFFLQMGDFQSARQTLKRAYHLKTPISGDAKHIAQQLKVLVALCRTEDELITVEATNFERRKALYERMGDGACKLRNFAKAIDYYRRMLECAVALGEAGRQLLPCYVSLYQTYTDNQQYELALEYLWKEHEIIANEPKEAYHTLLQIARLYELQNKSFFDIDDIYRRARAEAKQLQSIELERIAVQRAVKLLRTNCMDLMADNLEQEATGSGIDLSIVEPDSEPELPDTDEPPDVVEGEEEGVEQNTPNVGDDVDLAIDLSDNSDVEGEANLGGGIGGGQKINTTIIDGSNTSSTSAQTRTRKRGMTFAVRRNNKGETQLHQAAIAGNAILVERLIDQGHPVNVRDHAGWLPLHEACIHGHAEIVTTLLDRGAHLNDKGGTSCDGITPLYDACCNGRLEVIEVLLDRGANATQQTDFGDTTLNVLDTWYVKRRARLASDEIAHYERVRERLVTKFNAAAVQISPPTADRLAATKAPPSGGKTSIRRRLSSSDSDPPSVSSPNDPSSKRKSLRWSRTGSSGYGSMGTLAPSRHRNTAPGCDSERSDSDDSQNGGSDDGQHNPVGVSEYRSTMKALRKNRITDQERRYSSASLTGQKKRLAHMATDEVDADDWLIEDMQQQQQSAKRTRISVTLPRTPPCSLESKMSSTSFKNLASPEAIDIDEPSPPYTSPTDRLSALLDADDYDPFEEGLDNCDNCHNEKNDGNSAFNVLMKNSAKSFRRIQVRRASAESRASLTRRHSGADQSSLLDVGFERVASPSFDEQENLTPPYDVQLKTPVKITQPSGATTPQKTPIVAAQPKQSFHVVLDDGKTFNLCFNERSLFSTRTIGWLQNEIAKQYITHHGKRPTVKIQQSETTIGLCAFSDTELLNVLSHNSSQGDSMDITVYGQVRGYEHVSFEQFYDEYCRERNIANDSDLRTSLVKLEHSGTIVLGPDFAQTVPLIRRPTADTLSMVFMLVFFQQDWVNHLDLSVNGITDKDMEALARYLPSCRHLRVLRLALNLLTSRSVEMLCYGVNGSRNGAPSSGQGSVTVGGLRGSLLEELDLSRNPLEDVAVAPLVALCKELPSLRSLHLQSTDITTIDEAHLAGFDISRLETFDVSENRLTDQSVQYLLNQLTDGRLREANFHSLAALCADFKPKLWQTLSNNKLDGLRVLILANCRLSDDEMESTVLPAIGRNCENLIHLDLSLNVALSKRTFLAVLRQCNGAVYRLEQVHFRHDVQLWAELDTVSQAELLQMIDHHPSTHYPRHIDAMLPVGGHTTAERHETLLALMNIFWRTLWPLRTSNITRHEGDLHVTLGVAD